MCNEIPWVSVQDLKASVGDLIEIDRGRYRHWVMYAGKGMVLQVTGLEGEISVKWARIRLTDIDWVSYGRLVRVNNKESEGNKRSVTARSSEQTVRDVIKSVGAVVPYNIMTRNCEHYVTEWKFGLGWSEQVTLWNAVAVGGYISYNFMCYFLRQVKTRTAEYLRCYVRVNDP